jgi:hypothetical protein
MADNQKFCPLIRQTCIANQCEFYHEHLKRCHVSVLSYNVYRLTDGLVPKSGTGKKQETRPLGNNQGPNAHPSMPNF